MGLMECFVGFHRASGLADWLSHCCNFRNCFRDPALGEKVEGVRSLEERERVAVSELPG